MFYEMVFFTVVESKINYNPLLNITECDNLLVVPYPHYWKTVSTQCDILYTV